MELFFNILRGTPWWVFCLFVYFLVIGIRAQHRQVVSFPKVFFLPLGLTVWSLFSLISEVDLIASFIWSMAYLVGILSGWEKNRRMVVIEIKENAMTIPGSRSTIYILLALFFTKYFLTICQEIRGDAFFGWANVGVSSLASGFFLGKVLKLRRKYAKSLHLN